MKADSIRKHLKPYKLTSRSSTISHAFAAGLAPFDEYKESKVRQALKLLRQDPDDLKCVYCSASAATWDHLVSIVKEKEFRGYGHQIGNLVPACRSCNEIKGGKDFREFLGMLGGRNSRFIQTKLEKHLKEFAVEIDVAAARKRNVALWRKYEALRKRVHTSMAEADEIAAILRSTLR